ncbi:hypothetical protein SNEBB_008501, partial [Seison nebaliae]
TLNDHPPGGGTLNDHPPGGGTLNDHPPGGGTLNDHPPGGGTLNDHPPGGGTIHDHPPGGRRLFRGYLDDGQVKGHTTAGQLDGYFPKSSDHLPNERPPADRPPDDHPPNDGPPDNLISSAIPIPNPFATNKPKSELLTTPKSVLLTTPKSELVTPSDNSIDPSRFEPDVLAVPEVDDSIGSKNATTVPDKLITDNQIFQEMVGSQNSTLNIIKPTEVPISEGLAEDLDVERDINETESSNFESDYNNETSEINVDPLANPGNVQGEMEEIKEIDDFDLRTNVGSVNDKKIVCDEPVDKLVEQCSNENRNVVPDVSLENHNKIFLYLNSCLEISSTNRLMIESKEMYPVLPETLAFTTQTWKDNLPQSMLRPEFQGPYTQFEKEFMLKNFGENGIWPQSLDKFRKENFNHKIKLKTSKLPIRNDLKVENEEEVIEIRKEFAEHFAKKMTTEAPTIPEEYMMNVVNMTETADRILRKIYYLHHFRIMGIITTNYFNTIYCVKFSPTKAFSSVFRTVPSKIIREECSYELIEAYDHRHVYNGIHLLEVLRRNYADAVIRNKRIEIDKNTFFGVDVDFLILPKVMDQHIRLYKSDVLRNLILNETKLISYVLIYRQNNTIPIDEFMVNGTIENNKIVLHSAYLLIRFLIENSGVSICNIDVSTIRITNYGILDDKLLPHVKFYYEFDYYFISEIPSNINMNNLLTIDWTQFNYRQGLNSCSFLQAYRKVHSYDAIPPLCGDTPSGDTGRYGATEFLKMKRNQINSQSELIGRYTTGELVVDYNSVEFPDSIDPIIKDENGLSHSLRELLIPYSKEDLTGENSQEILIQKKPDAIPRIDEKYFTDLNIHKDVSPKPSQQKSSATLHPMYRTFQVTGKRPTYETSQNSNKFVSRAKLNIGNNNQQIQLRSRNRFKANDNLSRQPHSINDKVRVERLLVPYKAQSRDQDHVKMGKDFSDGHPKRSKESATYLLEQPKELHWKDGQNGISVMDHRPAVAYSNGKKEPVKLTKGDNSSSGNILGLSKNIVTVPPMTNKKAETNEFTSSTYSTNKSSPVNISDSPKDTRNNITIIDGDSYGNRSDGLQQSGEVNNKGLKSFVTWKDKVKKAKNIYSNPFYSYIPLKLDSNENDEHIYEEIGEPGKNSIHVKHLPNSRFSDSYRNGGYLLPNDNLGSKHPSNGHQGDGSVQSHSHLNRGNLLINHPVGGDSMHYHPPGEGTRHDHPPGEGTRHDHPPGEGTRHDHPPGGGTRHDHPPGGGTRHDHPPGGGTLNDHPPGGGTLNDHPPGGGTLND